MRATLRAARAIPLVLAAASSASCWRTITDAPKGTPPLVIRIPPGPFLISEPVPIEATWQAGCVKTFYMLQDRVVGDEKLDLHIDKSIENVACNAQRFTAVARCVPGPCSVYTGSRGKSRTLSVVFGAPGTHSMTLTIDNGSIRKDWTTDMVMIAPDAIRLTCRARERDQDVRCDERRMMGATFQIAADVYAAGRRVSGSPTITLDGVKLKEAFVRPPPGVHRVSAWYDGLRADLAIAVDFPPQWPPPPQWPVPPPQQQWPQPQPPPPQPQPQPQPPSPSPSSSPSPPPSPSPSPGD
jgi:hypothetical protein